MSSEGFQITIPTFDDDDTYVSTPIPFGRPSTANAANPSSSFGQVHDSPTSLTPMSTFPDRTDRPFHHSREDSGQSFDSEYSSIRMASNFTNGNGSKLYLNNQSSQTSLSSFGPTKKSSLAALKHAFKSSSKSDKYDQLAPPPMPHGESHGLPLPTLRNPFSRSHSALAHVTPPPPPRKTTNGGQSSHRTRPSTPNSVGLKRGNHSYSGSVFQASDTGSDSTSRERSLAPPPVPKMHPGRRSPSMAHPETHDKVSSEPRTPAEFALHAVFTRFVTAAEMKIEAFVKQGQEREPYLPHFLGPGVDPVFDELLESFSRIAQKHAQALVTSILRWRKTVGSTSMKQPSVYDMPTNGRSLVRNPDSPLAEKERRSLAAIYVMCRALIIVIRSMPKDTLTPAMSTILEETTFEQFRNPNVKLLQSSANHRANADLFGTLLGHISNVRFDSVTDRFVSELRPLAQGQVSKDLDMKYENLVKGVRHIQIKVWPPESFEDGAYFLNDFAQCFGHAHGQRLKSAFAETLVQLLHHIGKTAQAEVNDPIWEKAIGTIFPKAKEMMTKPRYWAVAYPLVISSICVAPHDYFLKNWVWCFEAGLPKLREKACRAIIMNGMVRLFWTYLYRCREPATTVAMKLDAMIKHFFPPTKVGLTIAPDESLDALIVIVHMVLSRHMEFGIDLTMSLMQETVLKDIGAQRLTTTEMLSPEKMIVAMRAILLSLTNIEKEQAVPAWPSNPGYTDEFKLGNDYTFSANLLPDGFFAKPGIQEFFDRCGPLVTLVTNITMQHVGMMSILDDQWTPARFASTYDDPDALVVRHTADGPTAYPRNLFASMQLLQTCFDSWPRCLHPSMDFDDAIIYLIRGILHIEPAVAEAASQALRRIISNPSASRMATAIITRFLFAPRHIAAEGSGIRMPCENKRILDLWTSCCTVWLESLEDGIVVQPELRLLIDHIQAGGLFLLASNSVEVRKTGLRMLKVIATYPDAGSGKPPVLETLQDASATQKLLADLGNILEADESHRLEQWLQARDTHEHTSAALLATEDEEYVALWKALAPPLFRILMETQPKAILLCRETMQSVVLRYHSLMSQLAEISGPGKSPMSPTSRTSPVTPKDTKDLTDWRGPIDQWRMWVRLLCATAQPQEGRATTPKEHSRVPSDFNSQRDRISTARGLFRHIIPFLSSEHTVFREGAVFALGCIDRSTYQTLLEDLQAITRHIYDDPRGKSLQKPVAPRSRHQDRLYTTVAHIYRLTAPFILQYRAFGDSTSLHLVLQFVRETQNFLSGPDIRGDWELQPLRRFFCGIVQHLFMGLSMFKDADRFISPGARLKIFRLCEEWCLMGRQTQGAEQRHLAMQASARNRKDPRSRDFAVQRFEAESTALSAAAACAMTALCEGAFYNEETSSPITEASIPLDVASTLDRLYAMLSAPTAIVQKGAKKALHDLLTNPRHDKLLYSEALQCSLLSPYANQARIRFFEVVSEIIIKEPNSHHFTFGQSIFLGLVNINHSHPTSRRNAFALLEAAHERYNGLISLAPFESAMGSLAPNVYLHAQRQLSEILANEHLDQAASFLAQATTCLVHTGETSPLDLHSIVANALQFLEPWIADVDLMPDGHATISSSGRWVLRSLITLTARFMDHHPDQIQSLWARLVDNQYPMNSTSTVSFLMEHASRMGDSSFVACATRIIACLSRTPVGQRTFEDLCSFIEPQNMVASITSSHPVDIEEDALWNAELAFTPSKEELRFTPAPAQMAWMFLGDVAPDRAWELVHQLPPILHALFTHADHRVTFVRRHARRMIFQVVRSWLPGMDELPGRATLPGRAALKKTLEELTDQENELFWLASDSEAVVSSHMKKLADNILGLLEPLLPSLRQEWGRLALEWGTSCPIRGVAFRSLQLFRVLMPRVDRSIIASLMGRLSNTISDQDENIQSFGAELILTLKSLVTNPDTPYSFLPLLFWGAAACLSTGVEQEYMQALELLEALLDKLDLDDLSTVDSIFSQKPDGWEGGEFNLQALALQGMRSAVTYKKSFAILCRLAELETPDLIDPQGTRVRDLYTICLVWCLHATQEGNPNHDILVKLAMDVSRLADAESLSGISRILISFAKRKFRTKDDFSRQGIAALREEYASREWNDVVKLLLSMVLNKERWVREKAMQVLRVLFQHRDTQHPDEALGSELLMPLLRLLQTDLAPQALEVLDVHMPMSQGAGPPPKELLRMSMHEKSIKRCTVENALIFGLPQESGWCVANPATTRGITRNNAMAVFDACKATTRPSVLHFEPDLRLELPPLPTQEGYPSGDQSLGELVSTLHDLNSFFTSDLATLPNQLPPPTQEAEDRVAAILARSLARTPLGDKDWEDEVAVEPPTPFIDAFSVPHSANGSIMNGRPSLDSRGDSESDTEDAFAFDKYVAKSPKPSTPSSFLRRMR